MQFMSWLWPKLGEETGVNGSNLGEMWAMLTYVGFFIITLVMGIWLVAGDQHPSGWRFSPIFPSFGH